MSSGKVYLAVDLGGGSGRVIAGYVLNGALQLDEIYRFANNQVMNNGVLCWDNVALFKSIKKGLSLAAKKYDNIESIGIDSWGVDFGLINSSGELVGNTVCYRDERTKGVPDVVFDKIDMNEHYKKVGIQIMSINTLFQLYFMSLNNQEILDSSEHLLFTPDLYGYMLTGVAKNEYCIASTSEMIDATTRDWDWELIDKLSLPRKLFGEIVHPETVLACIKQDIADECGLDVGVKVVSVGSHDTSSAVFALPVMGDNVAFLSSGTWSLLGMVLDDPILTDEARIAGFTNEGGVGCKIRFLQNITGLWILQRLIKEWEDEGLESGYDKLFEEALLSTIESVIDVDDDVFTNPKQMEGAIKEYCVRNGIQVPHTQGDIVRLLLISLAQRYKKGIADLERITGKKIDKLYVVGGGSRNEMLNQFTADALNIPLFAGAVEATAIGNILLQLHCSGEYSELNELKQLALQASKLTVYYGRNDLEFSL